MSLSVADVATRVMNHLAGRMGPKEIGEAVAFAVAELNGTAVNAPIAHEASHAVGGSDAVFPADPGADRYLKWNDTLGAIEWATVAGGGDMLAATYDPQSIEGDAFDTDQHTDGLTNGVYTLAERSKLVGVEASAVALATVKADADIADAVSKKHTQNADTDLDATFEASIKSTDNHTSGSTNKVYTATEQTKLSGIETGADVTGSHAPQAHKTSHENGGADEVSVAGLSGLLADDQHVLDAEALAAAVQSGAITDGVNLAPTHDAVYDVKVTADAAQPAATDDADAVAAVEAAGAAFAENKGITLDIALSTDGKWNSILQVAGIAGTNLAFGEAVYFAVADSKWEKAKGDAEATVAPMTGIVVVAGNEDAAITVMLIGSIRADAAFPALTVGAPVFISAATAGAITTTELTTGQYQKAIGWATSADSILLTGNPDWVKVG